jgi:hypothetical protein
MILGQGLPSIFIGVAIGIAGSFALTRIVQSLLLESPPPIPTFGAVTRSSPLSLLPPATSLSPRLRVDPVVALRYE